MRNALQILEEVAALEFSLHHTEPVKNEIAADLNSLVGRIQYQLEMDGDETDCEWAEDSLRVVKRVAEFDEIKREGGK